MKKVYAVFLLAGIHFSQSTKAQSDYNNVAGIFYAHCTSCHHDGGGAPFPLMNYDDASSMSNSIYSAVNTGIMPPWHADTAYIASGRKGPRMLHENTLTLAEKNAVLQWINDGALQGDASLTPKAPSYGDMTFKLNGVADLTLRIPTYHSNATPSQLNPYDCFVIQSDLTKDRWLRAYEIVPGNLRAVHHVVVSVDTTNTRQTDTTGNCASQGGQFGIGGWTPGCVPVIFPNQAPMKSGIRIPKGSSFILQIHYAPGSDGLIDSTKLRLFFYPENETDIRPLYSNTLLQNWGLFSFGSPAMPAGTIKTYKATSATSAFVPHAAQPTTDFTIYSVNPHSHSVCTKIKNYAYKGTDTIPLISIPNWDFKWEGNYFFPKPVKIPAGYTLEADHLYNNTTSNSHLSGAPKNTTWGQGTGDEMLFDSFVYLDYQTGDENIDLTAMIANDPLLTVGIKQISAPAIQSYIFPNPASENISVYLSKKSNYTGRMFNITGQTVLETGTFNEKITLDVQNMPPGLYVFEITDLITKERITKKVVINN